VLLPAVEDLVDEILAGRHCSMGTPLKLMNHPLGTIAFGIRRMPYLVH
jgi:hypothetical protein